MTPEIIEESRLAAVSYREDFGLNPLPSRPDVKHPFHKYAHLWNEPAPAEWFTPEGWPRTTNIQIMCGARWNLFVVDLDGEEALARWRDMGDCPQTWISHREGGASRHYWFSIPRWHTRPIRKCFTWKGGDKHEGIEILGENSLIVAPPSRHVKTGGKYRFLNEKSSPYGCSPAPAPKWVLNLKPIKREIRVPEFVPPRPKYATRAATPDRIMGRDEILDRIPDKLGLARELGVRLTGRVSPTGWAEAHAIDRPDEKPSAAVNIHTGVYTDRGGGAALSVFDLMVATGNAADFADACARLAERIR